MFIYRGKEYERLADFTARLQNQFPNAHVIYFVIIYIVIILLTAKNRTKNAVLLNNHWIKRLCSYVHNSNLLCLVGNEYDDDDDDDTDYDAECGFLQIYS